ncbi:MAG: GNAT family N-acetyltransferase [Cyanobacteria bacterium P01_G01_bin.38]
MIFAEYEVLERPFGWKVEYWDGQARLTPRGIGVTTRIDLMPRALSQPLTSWQDTLVPVDSAYTDQMIAGYFEVFADSVEFCDWPLEDIRHSADRDIKRYFSGEKGAPLQASVMALEPNTQKLAGLALFVLKPEQKPHLYLLYVRSPFQRQGVATAMVGWGMSRLIETEFQELFSTYHICNYQSRQWHHKFGFRDVYDAYYIRIRLGWLNNEIWRKEKLGELTGLATLLQERSQWQSQIESDV